MPKTRPGPPPKGLREDGDWSPRLALAALGPAKNPSDVLSHLIVALALVDGPRRVELLASRLEVELRKVLPRLQALAADPVLSPAGQTLDDVVHAAVEARPLLTTVRARAANDAASRPAGLRTSDLGLLASAVAVVTTTLDLITRPSMAGIARVFRVQARAPTLAEAYDWLERLLPGAGTPESPRFVEVARGHVVVAGPDRALLYDPMAARRP